MSGKVKSAKKTKSLGELVEIAYSRLSAFSAEEQESRLKAAAEIRFSRSDRKTTSKNRRTPVSFSSGPKRRATVRNRSGH
jgi:hypothetical protein